MGVSGFIVICNINKKLDISGCNRIIFEGCRLSLVQFLSDGKAKMKLAILSFLFCGELMKTSNGPNIFFLIIASKQIV